MKDMAVTNDEEHLLDVNTLYEFFDNNVNNNLVYAQMCLFKYLFCVIACHCLDNALTDKDNEILKFYSEFVLDKQYIDGSLKSLDYKFVRSFYYDYAHKLNNQLIERVYNNIKCQFKPRPTHVCPEHQKLFLSEVMKKTQKEQHISRNRHWYNNGVTNVFEYECPEGFVPGQLVTKESKLRGKGWYNNGVINVRAVECPEGFVPGKLFTKESKTRDRKWFNNGIKSVLEYKCPEGFVPGRLYKRKK